MKKEQIAEVRVSEYRVSSPDYGELIIEMIGGVKDQGTLEYLHTFIKLFIEKWG